MRNVELLIKHVRKQTENEAVSGFEGITDMEFVQYMNDAQYNVQSAIVQTHPRVFIKERVLTAVVGQERYDIPHDAYLKNKVHNVEYSPTGDEDDYYVLSEDTIKRRNPGISGSPIKYIRMAGQLLLTPQPQDPGKIRLNYVQSLRRLHKRAARVSSAVISSSGQFTISLDTANFSTDVDTLGEYEHICIVDSEGNRVVNDIKVSSIAFESITCEAHTVNALENETNTSIQPGHFVIPGKHSTSHGDLSDEVERYVLQYCAWKILKRDSSVDASEQENELMMLLKDIVGSYKLVTDDVVYIPQLNSWDDWSM